jgi:ubiquinone biosynthesis protein COQ9
MSEASFDKALIAAAFRLAAETGWARMSIADAAREAGLPLAEARVRFPGKRTLLRRFGVMLDQAALSAASQEGSVRDRLFDLLMGRFDAMKPHRDGIRALLRYLPTDPLLALDLACATQRSMRWMLQATGQSVVGTRGLLRVKALGAVWSWALRRFARDDSEDLAATMAALDQALSRADSLARWLSGRREPEEPSPPDASAVPEAGEV